MERQPELWILSFRCFRLKLRYRAGVFALSDGAVAEAAAGARDISAFSLARPVSKSSAWPFGGGVEAPSSPDVPRMAASLLSPPLSMGLE